MNRILIVDKDRDLCREVVRILQGAAYEALPAASSAEALDLIGDVAFDLAILDLHIDEMDGIRLMEELHKHRPGFPVLILTGQGSIESAVEAMQKGALNYITRPFNDRELLLHVERSLEKQSLVKEVVRLKTLVKERYGFENIVGNSDKMQRVMEQVSMAANVDSVVCIEGESGTGKELIARTMHAASKVRNGPFVALNCAAIPENLLENELFGHEKGAFTGALKSEEGMIRQAHQGSLFLDEISELDMSLQPKLLRVLEEKKVRPVGGGHSIDVDARIITASNKNLRDLVQAGLFREDLFYRIHVIPIYLPPLRERKESIPFLARKFLADHAREMDKKARQFSPGAMQKLLDYDWPGNVRELKNTVEYAVAMSTGDMITENLLLQTARSTDDTLPTLKEARRQCECSYLSRVIVRTAGNVSKAAKLAGKYRADLYKLLRKHDIDPNDYRHGKARQVNEKACIPFNE